MILGKTDQHLPQKVCVPFSKIFLKYYHDQYWETLINETFIVQLQRYQLCSTVVISLLWKHIFTITYILTPQKAVILFKKNFIPNSMIAGLSPTYENADNICKLQLSIKTFCVCMYVLYFVFKSYVLETKSWLHWCVREFDIDFEGGSSFLSIVCFCYKVFRLRLRSIFLL